jgi:hypothetical protein
MKKISIIISVAVLAVIGTLALTNDNSTQAEIDPNTITVKGSVTYPSEAFPDSFAVCALNLSTKQEQCTSEILNSDAYINGYGYELVLEKGEYNFFAKDTEGDIKFPAFYNAYMKSLVDSGDWPAHDGTCEEYQPINVNLDSYSGEDIAVGDWYLEDSCR